MRSHPRTLLRLAALIVAAGLLAASSLALAGCGAKADPAALEGTWQLSAFGGITAATPADPTVTTTLTMKGGTASGNGGVNSYGTTYVAKSNSSLTFGPVTSTLMAGPPAAMKQESMFFEGLKKTTHFEFNEGKLVFTGFDNDTVMIFVKK